MILAVTVRVPVAPGPAAGRGTGPAVRRLVVVSVTAPEGMVHAIRREDILITVAVAQSASTDDMDIDLLAVGVLHVTGVMGDVIVLLDIAALADAAGLQGAVFS